MIRASTRSGAAQRSRTRLVQPGISVNAVRTDRQFLAQVGPRGELGSVRCERSSSLQSCAMRRDAGVRGYQYPWLHWTRPDHVFVFYGGRDPLLCLSERALYAKTHPVQTNHLGVDGLRRSSAKHADSCLRTPRRAQNNSSTSASARAAATSTSPTRTRCSAATAPPTKRAATATSC